MAKKSGEPVLQHSLYGKFFHTFKEGTIEGQGKIVRDATGLPVPYVIVVFYSWLDGSPLHMEIVRLEKLDGVRFYDTCEEMREAYEHQAGVTHS
jgi:hypothetical protein